MSKRDKVKKICGVYLREYEEKQKNERIRGYEIIFERCHNMLKKYVES